MGLFSKLFGANKGPAPKRASAKSQGPGTARGAGQAEPPPDFSNPIVVEYYNFRGEHKTFTAAKASVQTRHAHLTMRVAPTGKRIALKRDKIANLSEVERRLRES